MPDENTSSVGVMVLTVIGIIAVLAVAFIAIQAMRGSATDAPGVDVEVPVPTGSTTGY